jgi:hypothetical protein
MATRANALTRSSPFCAATETGIDVVVTAAPQLRSTAPARMWSKPMQNAPIAPAAKPAAVTALPPNRSAP